MWTPNMPSGLYARSSGRFVVLLATQFILCATVNAEQGLRPWRASSWTLVISARVNARSFSGPTMAPLLVVELDATRSYEFLQREAALEPSAASQLVLLQLQRGCERASEIRQVYQVDVRLLIPSTHGVDALIQLGRAILVDAAGIDPKILKAQSDCCFAGLTYLLHACVVR